MNLEEKGSVALFIIIAILLFVLTLFSIFFFQNNKNIANDNNIDKIEEQYSQDINNINEIYEEELNKIQ